jgi:hypothetical protein
MEIQIERAPNDGPALKEVWAFVSRNDAGQENVIGAELPFLGMTALMTGNPKTFKLFEGLVRDARAELEAAGQTIHLLRFSRREEVEGWS